MLRNKEKFADIIVDILVDDAKDRLKISRISRKKVDLIRKHLLTTLSFTGILGFWFRFLKRTYRSHDDYVKQNLELAKEIISEEKNNKCKDTSSLTITCKGRVSSSIKTIASKDENSNNNVIMKFFDGITENQKDFSGLFFDDSKKQLRAV